MDTLRLSWTAAPADVMEWRRGLWSEKWGERKGDQRIASAIEQIKQAAAEKAGSFTALTPLQLQQAAQRFKKHTARGASAWSPAEWAGLPSEAWHDLADIAQAVESQCCLPRAELDVLIHFIGKPGTQHKPPDKRERPIAVLGALYRLIQKARKGETMAWARGYEAQWDDAKPGRSAQSAAMPRNIRCEVAARKGQAVVALLWDIEAFYDSIAIPDLVHLALEAGYPPWQLGLAVQASAAIRHLNASGELSRPVDTTATSILAGCVQSNVFAKIRLKKCLQRIHDTLPGDGPSQYVDDLAQIMSL